MIYKENLKPGDYFITSDGRAGMMGWDNLPFMLSTADEWSRSATDADFADVVPATVVPICGILASNFPLTARGEEKVKERQKRLTTPPRPELPTEPYSVIELDGGKRLCLSWPSGSATNTGLRWRNQYGHAYDVTKGEPFVRSRVAKIIRVGL